MTAGSIDTRTTALTVIDRENPWPGLDAYDERGKDYFRGRGDVAKDLLRLVVREDLVLLYGVSGLGKTSLLRAGLFPQLPANILPVYVRLSFVTADESGSGKATKPLPFTNLVSQVISSAQQAAAARGVEPPERPPQPDKGLWEYFRRADDGFWGPGDVLMTPLLVFDQFEEMFTRVESPHAAQRHFDQFLHDVAHLISGREPDWYEKEVARDENLEQPAYTRQSGVCKVVLSFREDYLANVKGLSRIIPSIDRIFVRLEPMTRKAAAIAVCEAGGHLMHGATDKAKFWTSARIIRKVTRAPGRLGVTLTVDSALLSLFCKELNDERKRRTPPLIDRPLVGSAEAARIFESFYSRAMAGVSPATQDFVERNLVLPGTRSRWPAAEQSALAAGVPAKDLEALAKLRIIRPDVSAGIARFELTHDVLVDVVLESRAHREEQARIDTQRKTLAEEAARTKRRMIEDWQRKRTVWSSVAAGVAILLLLLVATALFNVIRLQRQQHARMFADAAYSEIGQDMRLSAILARRAVDEAARSNIPMPLAEITLNNALRGPYVQARHSLDWFPLSMAVSDNGQIVVLVSETGQEIDVRRAPHFAEAQSLVLPRTVFSVEFDAASTMLFIVYVDTSVDRVDVRGGDLKPVSVVGPVSDDRETVAAAVSADGRRVLVSSVAAAVTFYFQDVPPWLSVLEEGDNAWQPPRIAAPGTVFGLSGDAMTSATLDSTGLLTATTARGQAVQHWVGASPLLELSADGARAVVVQTDQQQSLRVLTFDNDRVWTATLPRPADVTSARFSRDGTLVAVAQADGVVSIWDVADERAVFQVPDAQRFAFSPDSEEVLTWSGSHSVERWSARTGQRYDRLGRHDDVATIAATSSNQAPILTIAGRDLYVWSRPSVDRVLPARHRSEPVAAAISPDGALVAIAEPGNVHVYELHNGTLRHSVEEDEPSALAFSPDGGQLAIGTQGGELVLHQLSSAVGTRRRIAPQDSSTEPRSAMIEATPPGTVTALAFAPSSGQLAIAVRADHGVSRVVLYDATTDATRREAVVSGVVVALATADDSRVVVGVERPLYDLGDSTAVGSTDRVSFRLLPMNGSKMPATVDSAPPAVSPTQAAPPPPPLDPEVIEAAPMAPPPPPPPETSLRSPLGEGTRCQVGAASINADWTLGAAITTCERVVAHWRVLQGSSNSLNMERAVSRVAVSPVGDFIAVAFVNGAVWMYHVAFPSRPVVLQGAGTSVSWLGFNAGSETATPATARNLRLVAVRSQGSMTVYPVGSAELNAIAAERGEQWTLGQAECEQVFAGMPGMGPCAEVGFWRLLTRSIMPGLAGR